MNDEIRFEDVRISIIELWRKKWLILAVSCLIFLIGILYTSNKQVGNTYVANSSICSASSTTDANMDKNMSSIMSYTDLATSRKVCESAAAVLSADKEIDAETIQGMVSITQTSENVISISAISQQPEKAVEVANAMAEAFVRELTTITGMDSIQILDTASEATLKSNGTKELLKKRLIFLLAGFALSCGVIFILELFSNRVRTIVQCIDEDEEELLGIVPFVEE